ncbi:hypothetical protein [Halococcus hamelinensis]|uniref:Uncharacterized protein n=1 Tax=Halococcus hamelinensis 100A6 TaxID=1132509 RepID=M0M5B8_9EURY|nr:hypothetical protein [Halococcus hamelinensis]EMA39555.1 hypothetical protein C447_06241 [Halococcus hamelinensis 100A6]
MGTLDSVRAFFQRDIVYLTVSALFVLVGLFDIVARTGAVGLVLGVVLIWLGLSRFYGFYMGERVGETVARRFGR